MELVPDGVLVEHILAHLSSSSLGDLCRLSEVCKRFRRLLLEKLSAYGHITRVWELWSTDKRMRIAAFEGLWDFVFYCIRMGASDMNLGMAGAGEGGHRDLVDYFISRGADNMDFGMSRAALGGYRELVENFVSRGAVDWDWGLWMAAKGGHRKLVDYFVSKGATDLTRATEIAREAGRYDLVAYFDEISQ